MSDSGICYGSNKILWQVISSVSVWKPKDVLDTELKNVNKHLLRGVSYYEKASNATTEKFKRETNENKDFILKLSEILNLDALQSRDLFSTYLLYEYQGLQSELKNVIAEERHSRTLLIEVWKYYHNERLYILRCLKHLLSYWKDETHPYYKSYHECIESLAGEKSKLIESVQQQYEAVCAATPPTIDSSDCDVAERLGCRWVVYNLKEQLELLQIMLLYYKDETMLPESFLRLLALFKRQGFGQRQENKHLLETASKTLLTIIGNVQVLILLKGIHLEWLFQCQDRDSEPSEYHLLASEDVLRKINNCMEGMGEVQPHGPVLLAWGLAHYVTQAPRGTVVARRLGRIALQCDAFEYLLRMLRTAPFSGNTVVATLSKQTVYSLLQILLQCFDEETLGSMDTLYEIAREVLRLQCLAQNMWDMGLEKGVGLLLTSAIQLFPLDPAPVLRIGAALASACQDSAEKVIGCLHTMKGFSKYLDVQDRVKDCGEGVLQLVEARFPYPTESFLLPPNIYGQSFSAPEGQAIRWQCDVNGWQVCLCEVHSLLQQLGRSAGHLEQELVENVTAVGILVYSILHSDRSKVQDLAHLSDMLLDLLQRLSQIAQPPLKLISACLQVAAEVAAVYPALVWEKVSNSGMLPSLGGENLQQIVRGRSLERSTLGGIIAGLECPCGEYAVTLAFLQLLRQVIQGLWEQTNCNSSLVASLMFMMRDVFAGFHKWRYNDPTQKQLIGQQCLEIFHNILTLEKSASESQQFTLQQVCCDGLLYTDAGNTLLSIVSVGVEEVQVALEQQTSWVEGAGVELIGLLRFALSVLNRLLLLKPGDQAASPVEQTLGAAQPASGPQRRHATATIAQYVYHRYDPRLPALATLLLKRVAVVFPMSLLACLGSSAEAVRDVFVLRLQFPTEDVRLKIAILEFLATCVKTQPGLIELFLSLTELDTGTSKRFEMGKFSCLHAVLEIIQTDRQKCPAELQRAAVEFVAALWTGRRETAMTVLREKKKFWTDLCSYLMLDSVSSHVKTCAYVMRTVAAEMYSVQSYDKLDKELYEIMKTLIKDNRLSFWSKFIQSSQSVDEAGKPDDQSPLLLLTAWRDLLLILAREECVQLPDKLKGSLLSDVLESVHARLSDDGKRVAVTKILSEISVCLIVRWSRNVSAQQAVMGSLGSILHEMRVIIAHLHPKIQLALLATMATVVRNLPKRDREQEASNLVDAMPDVYAILQYNMRQSDQSEVYTKLRTVNICLLKELIAYTSEQARTWVVGLQEHSMLPLLLIAAANGMQRREREEQVQAIMELLLTLCRVPRAASSLASSGLTEHLCLPLLATYVNRDKQHEKQGSWSVVYRLGLYLYANMLAILKYSFLPDALSFIGVHQDCIKQSMEQLYCSHQVEALLEAEAACVFVEQLSRYSRQWQLEMPEQQGGTLHAVQVLTHTLTSLLIRPRFLQHILEKPHKLEAVTEELLTPVRLHHQSSSSSICSDDMEKPTELLIQTQSRFLHILMLCLSILKNFAPDLLELFDESLDVMQFKPVLELGFSAPALEKEGNLTFGTLVTLSNYGVRMLMKADVSSLASPSRSPNVNYDLPNSKSVVTYLMETSLGLLMCQACLYLRNPRLAPRDKQLLKRELSTELTSYLMAMYRHVRRGAPPSPGSSYVASPGVVTKPPPLSSSGKTTPKFQTKLPWKFSMAKEQAFFRLVQQFVESVLM
ncbi:PREDICTED: nucleoporin NUP188 homolog [Priapulus caudatus]|uniref:Nucleoporin NUP188 n=1 Tax=Priapulus caudatus TaxID=37621 RepID=A0ABM1F9V9_PRICU|nr:PREDICTED: nucleoporin NUP188 homolog [Priapulus caudatus]